MENAHSVIAELREPTSALEYASAPAPAVAQS
jgi:hypothetical protein